MPPDRAAAGEEEVVEGEPGEGVAHGGTALDHRHALRRERLPQQCGERAGGGRRVLAGLDQHPVPRREGRGGRHQGEHDRVVPARDHAHHAEGLGHDPDLGQERVQRGRPPLRRHQPAQVPPEPPDVGQGRDDLTADGLEPRPGAEVRLDGDVEPLPPGEDRVLERTEVLQPLRAGRGTVAQERGALALEQLVQGSGVHRPKDSRGGRGVSRGSRSGPRWR